MLIVTIVSLYSHSGVYQCTWDSWAGVVTMLDGLTEQTRQHRSGMGIASAPCCVSVSVPVPLPLPPPLSLYVNVYGYVIE